MAKKLDTSVPVPFYVCRRPDFDEVLDDCDRPLLEWIESVPVAQRTPPMRREMNRIATETHAARDSALAQCEAGRFASGDEDDGEPHLRVAITSRLDGQRSRSSATTGDSNPGVQVTVSFSPAPCAPVPFEVLHRIAEIGVNHHPGISGEWRGAEAPQPNGIGAFEGAHVVYSGRNSVAALLDWLRPAASFRSRAQQPLFSAWATHEPHPASPPDELLERCEAYDPDRVHIDLDPGVPYIRYRVELRNLTTGAVHSTADIVRYLSDSDLGAGEGGLVFHTDLPYSVGVGSFPVLTAPEDIDGEWLVRVGLLGVGVPGGTAQVEYGGQLWADGVWQHLLLAGTPLPAYAAVAEGYLGLVRSIPASAVGGRILGFDPVPGVGVIMRVELINPAPVAACVVFDPLPYLSGGTGGRVRIVRNLDAGATSEPVSILFPLTNFTGDEDRIVSIGVFDSFLVPSGTLPDGFTAGPQPELPDSLVFSTIGHKISPRLFYLPDAEEAVSSGSVTLPLRRALPAPENWLWAGSGPLRVMCTGEIRVVYIEKGGGTTNTPGESLHYSDIAGVSMFYEYPLDESRHLSWIRRWWPNPSSEEEGEVLVQEDIYDRYPVNLGVGGLVARSGVAKRFSRLVGKGYVYRHEGDTVEVPFREAYPDVWRSAPEPFGVGVYFSQERIRDYIGAVVDVNLADARAFSDTMLAFSRWAGGDIDTMMRTLALERLGEIAPNSCRNATVVEVLQYFPLLVSRMGLRPQVTTGPTGSMSVTRA